MWGCLHLYNRKVIYVWFTIWQFSSHMKGSLGVAWKGRDEGELQKHILNATKMLCGSLKGGAFIVKNCSREVDHKNLFHIINWRKNSK